MTGSVDAPGCVDFTTTVRGEVTVNAINTECTASSFTNDPFLELFDGAGVFIEGDDDDGAGFCSLIRRVLEPGSYSICLTESSDAETATATVDGSFIPETVLALDAPCNPASLVEVCDRTPTQYVGDELLDTLACVTDAGISACRPIETLALGATCSRTNTAQACVTDSACLRTAVGDVFTCALLATPADEGSECLEGANTAFPCQAGLACVDVDGPGVQTSRCFDPRVAACEFPTTIASGTTGGLSFAAGTNLINPSCSTGRVERAFSYTIQNNDAANVRVIVSGQGGIAVAGYTDCVANDEVQCVSGTNDIINTLRGRFVRGESVLILVEGAIATNTFSLTIEELPVTVRGPGATCDPVSTDEVCFAANEPALACVGGPSPRGFACGVPARNDEGESCLSGSTDQLCAAGLGCIANTCVVVPDPGDRTDPLRLDLPIENIPALIDPIAEVDCYSFVVESPIALAAQTAGDCATAGLADTNMVIERVIGHNAAGVPTLQAFTVASNNDAAGLGQCSRVTPNLSVGEYLVCLNENGNNALAAGITLSAIGTPRSALPDSNGNTFQTPVVAAAPSTTPFAVAAGETDCVAFTLAAPATVRGSTAGCTADTLLNLFDVSGVDALVLGRDDDGGGGVCSQVTATLEAGDYLFCVDEFGNDGNASGNIAITVQ